MFFNGFLGFMAGLVSFDLLPTGTSNSTKEVDEAWQASASFAKYLQYWVDEKIHVLREALASKFECFLSLASNRLVSESSLSLESACLHDNVKVICFDFLTLLYAFVNLL